MCRHVHTCMKNTVLKKFRSMFIKVLCQKVLYLTTNISHSCPTDWTGNRWYGPFRYGRVYWGPIYMWYIPLINSLFIGTTCVHIKRNYVHVDVYGKFETCVYVGRPFEGKHVSLRSYFFFRFCFIFIKSRR